MGRSLIRWVLAAEARYASVFAGTKRHAHLHDNLPVLLVGGASGQLKGGRHVRYPKDTPMPNLFLTMFDMLGVPKQSSLGDSTGRVDLSRVA